MEMTSEKSTHHEQTTAVLSNHTMEHLADSEDNEFHDRLTDSRSSHGSRPQIWKENEMKQF